MLAGRMLRKAGVGLLLVPLVFGLGCGGASGEDATLEAPALPTQRLTVDGPRLRDALGREVILRGFNAGGRAKMPPFLPFDVPVGGTIDASADDFFARLAAVGANTVRLTLSWEAFEPTEGTYDMAYLDRYAAILDAARANGFFAIVDFHQDVFASPFCGDGFPLWAIGDVPHGDPHYDCTFPLWSLPAFNASSDVSACFDRLWTNEDGLQDAMEAMWRIVAAELAGHPAVAAFEVLNEPAAGSNAAETFDATILPGLYTRMGTAIREEAGDVPIFWDERIGSSGAPEFLVPPSVPSAVFAPHYYEPLISIGFETVARNTIRTALEGAFSMREAWNMPVVLGEFGVPNANGAKAEYIAYVYDLLDELRGHGLMWEGGISPTLWNGEDFSIFEGNGDERPWASVAVRPYPRAISGTIARFAWNAAVRRFELDVTGAGSEVSEVYLPARHFGDAPRVQARGAQYRHVPERELLLLRAPAGTDYSVVVDP